MSKILNAIRYKFEYYSGTSSEFISVLSEDTHYTRNFHIAIIGFLLAIIGFFTVSSSFFMWLISLVGLIVAFISCVKVVGERKFLGAAVHYFKVVTKNSEEIVNLDNNLIRFEDVKPSFLEKSIGFQSVAELSCNEVAFASHSVDENLTNASKIPFLLNYAISDFIKYNDKARRHQLSFLYGRIKDKPRTTNGLKVRLVSSLESVHQSVNLEKTDYFKGLLTSEAFRSDVEIVDKNEAIDRESNGTNWFPIRAGASEYELQSFPILGVSGHIGTTPFALSPDGIPMFALQHKKNNIAAGELVLRGSGSMDFADLNADTTHLDFGKTLKHSMARELVEETSKLMRTTGEGGGNKGQRIIKLREKIMLCGFFLWVNRCGKPEFLGAVRLSNEAGINDFDGYEVEKHQILDEIKPIQSDQDLINMYDFIRNQSKYTVSLSSLMAFRRVATICSYNKFSSEMHYKVKKRLIDNLEIIEKN